jgi:hypothetical protein
MNGAREGGGTYVGFFRSILTLGVNLRGAEPPEDEDEDDEEEEAGGPPGRRETRRSGPLGDSGFDIGSEPNLEGTTGRTRGGAGAAGEGDDDEGAGGAPDPPPFGAGCIFRSLFFVQRFDFLIF